MDKKRRGKRKTWHKDPSLRATCPTCNKVGSGMYVKWVLNEQKRRYEPYYYFAHPILKRGKWGTKWCYVRKKRAQQILASKVLRDKYGIEQEKVVKNGK